MNLKQLEVFINVAETGSFSKGAEATFLTQSTVSQHISALEEEFGLRLLDRTGKGALLTEGGKLLLGRARKILECSSEITAAMARFKGVEEANLSVAGSSIPGEYMIPAALPHLMECYPGLVINVLQGDSRKVLRMLISGEVELGIVGGKFDEDGIDLTPFATDELVLIAPAFHSWRKSTTVAISELVDQPFILRESGSGTGWAALETLRGAGIDPGQLRVSAQLGSNEAIKQAVMAGAGISFVSALSVQRELTEGALIRLPVAGVKMEREFFIATRRDRELSPGGAVFCKVMREMYGR
ncbi:LysR family transcriptional regulator [Geomonas sp. Red32]|uniref:selenium metabolism-associated LysR family transcriptional regulator n=1 Tax=Geomonas sp. Red32 TaxID=2912856 RepID=UPI00202CE19A|nr:selenium metabolism-associated LysR family transcriptional regulator [Geomonas sp. Red32]MCM0081504.1 LysR family transcriptional regulator [Geomonas sp. Red32]